MWSSIIGRDFISYESHRVIYTPNKMQYFISNQFIHIPNYSLIGFSDLPYPWNFQCIIKLNVEF